MISRCLLSYKEVFELDECTGCRNNGYPCVVCCTVEELAGEDHSSLIAVPKLTRIPVFGESIHGEFAFEVIFGLAFELLKLFLSCVPLAVEFFQCCEGIA